MRGNCGSSAAVPGARLVAPGEVAKSVLVDRFRRHDRLKMPPLGRNVVDADAVAVMEAWIRGMTNDE